MSGEVAKPCTNVQELDSSQVTANPKRSRWQVEGGQQIQLTDGPQ